MDISPLKSAQHQERYPELFFANGDGHDAVSVEGHQPSPGLPKTGGYITESAQLHVAFHSQTEGKEVASPVFSLRRYEARKVGQDHPMFRNPMLGPRPWAQPPPCLSCSECGLIKLLAPVLYKGDFDHGLLKGAIEDLKEGPKLRDRRT